MNPENKPSGYLKMIYDIRHPLTNISLAIEMLEENSEEDKKEMFIEIIKKNVARISDITNEIIRKEENNY